MIAPGAHLALRDGYDQVPLALSKGLDIRLNTEVTSVHYSTDGEVLHSLLHMITCVVFHNYGRGGGAHTLHTDWVFLNIPG